MPRKKRTGNEEKEGNEKIKKKERRGTEGRTEEKGGKEGK